MLISENGKQLLQCDLRQLETRAKASVCLNTGLDYVTVDLKEILNAGDSLRFVRIFDNTERDQAIIEPIAIAVTHTQIIILQYNVKKNYFVAITALDTATPVKSIHFTPFTAIVSSDKFFEIDLNKFNAEEFLDLSELFHTVTARPFNTFKINADNYLMCFNEFGIFVDEFGCRKPAAELKWTKAMPTAFVYRAPILYVFSTDGIQLMRIHKSTGDELSADEITFIAMNEPRFGGNCEKYGIYAVSMAVSGVKQIIRIDGAKVLRNCVRFDSIETIQSDNIEF